MKCYECGRSHHYQLYRDYPYSYLEDNIKYKLVNNSKVNNKIVSKIVELVEKKALEIEKKS